MSEYFTFPDYFTIDELGLDALNYFLLENFKGKTVRISVEEEKINDNTRNRP